MMNKSDLSCFKTPLYKSYKMEDFLDLHFYHPLGLFFAKAAYKFSLTPNQVSLVSMAIGIAGGLMLAGMKTAPFGFVLIVFSGVLDSSDGQLARMTGHSSLSGRVLDGLMGYVSFTTAYLAIAYNYYSGGGRAVIFLIMAAAGFFSAVHSSMYDFYRTTYARVSSGEGFDAPERKEDLKGGLALVYSFYGFAQGFFASKHKSLLGRLENGNLKEENRVRVVKIYSEKNLKTVRLWNMLGDNVKILGILLAMLAGKIHWYFYFVIFALNAVFVFNFFAQRKTDSSFLIEVESMEEVC